jgi:hypothetical protein
VKKFLQSVTQVSEIHVLCRKRKRSCHAGLLRVDFDDRLEALEIDTEIRLPGALFGIIVESLARSMVS